jgi:hypothetical protein
VHQAHHTSLDGGPDRGSRGPARFRRVVSGRSRSSGTDSGYSSERRASSRFAARRGCDMTQLVPELERLPARGIFDGELVSFDSDGRPDFAAVCDRILNRDEAVPLTFVVSTKHACDNGVVGWKRHPPGDHDSMVDPIQLAARRATSASTPAASRATGSSRCETPAASPRRLLDVPLRRTGLTTPYPGRRASGLIRERWPRRGSWA